MGINRSGCIHNGFVLGSHVGMTLGGQSHGVCEALPGCGSVFIRWFSATQDFAQTLNNTYTSLYTIAQAYLKCTLL